MGVIFAREVEHGESCGIESPMIVWPAQMQNFVETRDVMLKTLTARTKF